MCQGERKIVSWVLAPAGEEDEEEVPAPTMVSTTAWRSMKYSTLEAQYTSAHAEDDESLWVNVPNMRVTAVHGLDDDEPAMAAALRQLADMNERPRKTSRWGGAG